MPGQYTPLRNSLQRRVDEDTPYSRKVHDRKVEILGELTKTDIAKKLKSLKRRAKKIEAIDKKNSFELLATEKALTEYLEESNEESFSISEGGSFSLGDAIYPNIKNKADMRKWAVDNGHENDLSIHHSTLQSICGDLLLNGQPLPNGVECYHELKINVRSIYDKE